MIREFESRDIEQVMDIWLASNTQAHPFIGKEYWQSKFDMVRELLPQADLMVYERDGEIGGFVGLMDGYIAGLFVSEKMRSSGIGKALIGACQDKSSSLSLSVYRRNERAVKFYLREGFMIQALQLDQDTGEEEYKMLWEQSSQEG